MSFQQEPRSAPQTPAAPSAKTRSIVPPAGSASAGTHADPQKTNGSTSGWHGGGARQAHAAAKSTLAATAPTRIDPGDTGQEDTAGGRAMHQVKHSGYHSPYSGAAFSGIDSNQDRAEDIAKKINGGSTPHGYSGYGQNPNKYCHELGHCPDNSGPPDNLNASDLSAIKNYADAANDGVIIKKNPDGSQTVKPDWDKLNVRKDDMTTSPFHMAQAGCDAVMADIKSNNKTPDDKGQFISLIGHSGGGQSGFYTALMLAEQGYTNLSLVGVDMALDQHQREALALSHVDVTNITSNAKDELGRDSGSLYGDCNKISMGGLFDENYYDINVHRKEPKSSNDYNGRHEIINDANVVTTIRFAQYLDSIQQHNNYTPELYDQFVKSTNGPCNKFEGKEAAPNLMSEIDKSPAVKADMESHRANSANPLAMYAD